MKRQFIALRTIRLNLFQISLLLLFSILTNSSRSQCEIDIDSAWQNGYTYDFLAQTSTLEANIIWSVNGNNVATGEEMIYSFSSPGDYEVCASFISIECPEGVSECVTINVEGGPCMNFSIFLGDGPTIDVEGSVIVLYDYVLQGDDISFEGVIPLISIFSPMEVTICIPYGCYNLTLNPGFGYLNANDIEYAINLESEEIASGLFVPGESSLDIEFGVNEDCTNNIAAIHPKQEMSVYPIPSSNEITVDVGSSIENCSISIYDLTGHLVLQEQMSNSNATISLQRLPNGLYNLIWRNAQMSVAKRIEIIR